jgi:hypothetical protein
MNPNPHSSSHPNIGPFALQPARSFNDEVS